MGGLHLLLLPTPSLLGHPHERWGPSPTSFRPPRASILAPSPPGPLPQGRWTRGKGGAAERPGQARLPRPTRFDRGLPPDRPAAPQPPAPQTQTHPPTPGPESGPRSPRRRAPAARAAEALFLFRRLGRGSALRPLPGPPLALASGVGAWERGRAPPRQPGAGSAQSCRPALPVVGGPGVSHRSTHSPPAASLWPCRGSGQRAGGRGPRARLATTSWVGGHLFPGPGFSAPGPAPRHPLVAAPRPFPLSGPAEGVVLLLLPQPAPPGRRDRPRRPLRTLLPSRAGSLSLPLLVPREGRRRPHPLVLPSRHGRQGARCSWLLGLAEGARNFAHLPRSPAPGDFVPSPHPFGTPCPSHRVPRKLLWGWGER